MIPIALKPTSNPYWAQATSAAFRKRTFAVFLLGALVIGSCGVGWIEANPAHFKQPGQDAVVSGSIPIRLNDAAGPFPGGVIFMANGRTIEEDLLNPYEAQLDTSSFAEGPMLIEALHEYQLIAHVEVLVDNRGPRVEIQQPGHSTCVSIASTVNVSALLEDDVEIKNIELRLEGDAIRFEALPSGQYSFHYHDSFELTQELISNLPASGDLKLTLAAENTKSRVSNQSIFISLCPD